MWQQKHTRRRVRHVLVWRSAGFLAPRPSQAFMYMAFPIISTNYVSTIHNQQLFVSCVFCSSHGPCNCYACFKWHVQMYVVGMIGYRRLGAPTHGLSAGGFPNVFLYFNELVVNRQTIFAIIASRNPLNMYVLDYTTLRSVFKISCLFLRPRPWQFEIWDSTDT